MAEYGGDDLLAVFSLVPRIVAAAGITSVQRHSYTSTHRSARVAGCYDS